MGDLPSDLISLQEAGRILGVTRVTAWRWVKAGKLKGHTVADRILVSRAQVVRMAKRGDL